MGRGGCLGTALLKTMEYSVMKGITTGLMLLLMLAGCGTVPVDSRGWITPADAVRAVNESPSQPLRGEFVLTVRAIGSQGERTFLNSETDYRNQNNLTIAMRTSTATALEKRLGVALADLKGRRIVVLGEARRVRIGLFDDRKRPTGKYYFQTHVPVDSPTQVRFAH